MLSKEQKIAVYTATRDHFIAEKANPPKGGCISLGICLVLLDKILMLGEDGSSVNLLSEWWSFKPSLEERKRLRCSVMFWFELEDWNSRIEVLTKAIALCEAL